MEGTLSLVLVEMGGRRCAIPCDDIVEIVPRVLLDSVPEAPPGVLGVINLRGRVVPVMDVRERVGHPRPGGELPYQHLVIIRAGQRQIGLAADEVLDVLSVARDSVEKPGHLAGGRGPGVVRVEDDLVLVLEPEDVLHAVSA